MYNVSQAVLLTIRVQEFHLQNPRSYYHNKRAVTGLRIDVLSPENALRGPLEVFLSLSATMSIHVHLDSLQVEIK